MHWLGEERKSTQVNLPIEQSTCISFSKSSEATSILWALIDSLWKGCGSAVSPSWVSSPCMRFWWWCSLRSLPLSNEGKAINQPKFLIYCISSWDPRIKPVAIIECNHWESAEIAVFDPSLDVVTSAQKECTTSRKAHVYKDLARCRTTPIFISLDLHCSTSVSHQKLNGTQTG